LLKSRKEIRLQEEDRTTIASREKLLSGRSTVRFEFVYNGGEVGKKVGSKGPRRAGFGVDTGSPVSNSHKSPIAFGGTIRKVDIVLGDDALNEADRQHVYELNAKVARSKA
jgi:hypothetical protein